MARRNRTAYRRAETERLLESCSTQNRPSVELYLAYLEGRGRAIGTRRCAAGMLCALNRLVQGRPFPELTPNELTLALAAYARAHSGSTAHTFAAYVKAYYSWLHEGECPKPIKRVLMVGKPKPNRNIVPLTDEERDELLETAGKDPNRVRATMRQALIWLLWDSGFRCSEALGLRVGSVHFDDQGGAHLVIPADAAELKTGPRTIYVVECVAAVRVWLALHPHGSDEDAPLFCNLRDGSRQIPAYRVNAILRELTDRANMRAVWPHLFRHTRATLRRQRDPSCHPGRRV